MDSADALVFSRLKATIKIFPPFLFSFRHCVAGKDYLPCGFGVLGFPYIPLGVISSISRFFLFVNPFFKLI